MFLANLQIISDIVVVCGEKSEANFLLAAFYLNIKCDVLGVDFNCNDNTIIIIQVSNLVSHANPYNGSHMIRTENKKHSKSHA